MRGSNGSNRLLQEALGLKVDGQWGPSTQASLKEAKERNPRQLLYKLRDVRRAAEDRSKDPGREKFKPGLFNRFDRILRKSLGYLDEE